MRVFKVADGTSWVARVHDAPDRALSHLPVGWESILFEMTAANVAQRLVYRPRGWFQAATVDELAAALDEGLAVRVRWGD